MATIIQRQPLKNGETPYSIQIWIDGKFYNTTWRRPVGMKEHEAKRKLDLFASQFDEDTRTRIRTAQKEVVEQTDRMTFGELADRWLKLSNQKNSKTSIARNIKIVEELKDFLGLSILKRIKPPEIEKVLFSLNDRTVKKETARLKKPINEAVAKINIDKMCREHGFSTATVFYARQGVVNILWTMAERLCKGLGINVNEYFERTIKVRPFSKGSKLIYRRTLLAIFNYAVRLELIDKNPANNIFKVENITGTTPKKDTLKLDEIKALQKALTIETDIRKKAAVAMLLTLGIRKGELCGMKWSDIDLNRKTVFIQRSASYCGSKLGMITNDKPKTKSSIRTLFIPDNLLVILQEYKKWYDGEKERLGEFWHNEDWVFVKDDGRQIDAGTPTFWLRVVLTTNGIRPIGCHSLRHTAITLLLRQKLSPKIVSEFAGHSDPSVTLGIYSHVFDEDKAEIASYMNNLLASPC